MKKLSLMLALVAISMMTLVSCSSHDDYEQFIGTWGLEKLSYYYIDFAGNPITNTMENYYYTPGDMKDGIDLVFRADKSGEMIDRSRDTVYIQIAEDEYETIVCPDTVLVQKFTYSYDKDAQLLYLNMDYVRTFSMKIVNFSDVYFTYTNQYLKDIVERATMKRISDKPQKDEGVRKTRKNEIAPRKPGSLMAQ